MIRDERRKTKDERYRSQLQESGTENCMAQKIVFLILLLAVCAFAAPKVKSANAYYGDAAYQYFENRLPSAEITCKEGLEKYPNDSRLQMLLERIQEAKDEQQKENQKNNQNGNDQNQDQNQDENKDNQDQDKQNQDQNQDQQNQGGDSSSSSENSSDSNSDQNQNQGGGESSSSEASSNSNDGEQNQQQEQPEEQQADEGQEPEDPNAMSKAEAAQLLKDFDEQNGERKPWKPARGQTYPEKDW